MNNAAYLEILKLAMPEAIVAVAALVVLGVDLVVMRRQRLMDRQVIAASISLMGCLAAGLWLLGPGAEVNVRMGMLIADPLSRVAQLGLLVLTGFVLLVSIGTKFSEDVGEYGALVLFATVGMMLLASSDHLLLIFVALELTSLCLYLLTAFNRQVAGSASAALNYFLFGSVAGAFTLFGLSLVYGLTGELSLSRVAVGVRESQWDPLLTLALVMTLTGFGFKIAAVPFHLWVPEVYRGAPTPVAALVASGSKVAAFLVLGRLVATGFAGVEGSAAWRGFVPGWLPILAVLATASMVLGNLAAITQSNVKRLLAWSAIAHAGYALLGIVANNNAGVASLVYYVLTYGLTVLGAFAVVAEVEEAGGSEMEDFAGLVTRSPWLAVSMLVFLLSLAGIPPLAGFFGKFYVFAAAATAGGDLGLLWLVVLAIAMSAVSLYYYLQVLKQVFVASAADTAPVLRPAPVRLFAIGVMAVLVLVLGMFPGIVLSRLAGIVAGFASP